MVVVHKPNQKKKEERNKPGLMRRFRNLVLSNSPETISSPTAPDENNDAVNLSESHPYQVKKTIANCRFAYKNDPIVGGLILNNASTANSKFKIVTNNPNIPKIKEAMEHIEKKVIEWNLSEIISQTLIKEMRDGKCFIQKPIVNGTIQLNPLSYDQDKYDFKVINDPVTGQILGYVQKHPKKFDPKGWENKEWDDLNVEEDEEETTSYQAEEVIYPRLFVEDGEGESLVMRLLDTIYDKWTFQGFKIGVAHKTGNFVTVTVGTTNTSNKKVQKSFIDTLLDIFKNPVKKSAGVIPEGVEVQQLGNNALPAIPDYMEDIYKELYLGLQTPYGVFDAKGSTMASLKAVTDDETGFAVFIEYLRDNVKTYFEKDLINEELELAGFSECIGHLKITYSLKTNPGDLLTLSDLAELDKKGTGENESDIENKDDSILKTDNTPNEEKVEAEV